MIRPVLDTDTDTDTDTDDVIALAVSSGLFEQDESHGVRDLMAAYFARDQAAGHVCLLDVEPRADDAATEADGPAEDPVGVAYYQPTPATDRTWTLLMIAVRRDRQGQGRGGALLAAVEDDLRERGQRLLLVETSGVPGFARTRAFYDQHGYTAEARVRDYYQAGDDMVLYRKDLTDPTATTGPAARTAGASRAPGQP